jgi:hypothetical protein
MKYILPILLITVACGRIDVNGIGGTKLNSVMAISPLNGSDRANLQTICNALGSKVVAPGSTLTFKTFEGDCTGNTISNADVQAVISPSGGLVRKSDGQSFIFPDIETPSSGLLQGVCNNLSGFENTAEFGVTTTGSDLADCGSASENLCVVVKRAGVDGRIHTVDWMRVKVTDFSRTGKLGFFTYRKKVTRSYCGQNEQLTFTADLK